MQQYGNQGGDSGVVAFQISAGVIVVKFSDGWHYIYNSARPGHAIVLEMQRLARNGQGLNSYISRVVKDRWARRFQ